MTEQERQRVYVAAHYFTFISKRATKIASVLCIHTPELYQMLDDPEWRAEWHKSLDFWDCETPNSLPVGYSKYRYQKRKKEREKEADALRQRGELTNDLKKAETEWTKIFVDSKSVSW